MKDNAAEMKGLLDDLYKIIQTTNVQSQEQISINKELLKVIALLESGLIQNKKQVGKLTDDITNGFKIQDDYVQKISKQRGIEKSELDYILKKMRYIETITEQEIDNADTYIDLLRERYDIIDDEFDLTKQLSKSHKEILGILQQNKAIFHRISGDTVSIDTTLTKIISKRIDFNSVFSGVGDVIANVSDTLKKIKSDIDTFASSAGTDTFKFEYNFNPNTQDLDKEINRIYGEIETQREKLASGLSEQITNNKSLIENIAKNIMAKKIYKDVEFDVDTGQLRKGFDILERGTAEYSKIMKRIDKRIVDEDVISNVTADLQKMSDLIKIETGLTEEQTSEYQRIVGLLGVGNRIIAEQIKNRYDDLDVNKSLVGLESIKMKYLIKNKDLLQTTDSTVRKITDGFDYINSILPSGISSLVGLNNVSDTLLKHHADGLKKMTGILMEGGTRANALNGYYTEMFTGIKNILNPLNIAVITTVLLYKFTERIVDKYKELESEMQVSLLQSKNILDNQLTILTSTENQFSTMKDIQDIQVEMIGSSGKYYSLLNKGNSELILSISEMGKAFGYGSSEAAKIHKVFTDLGASDDLSKRLQENIGYMSEMSGLSPQIIGKDLVESADTVYTYFAGMPEEAAKAAIQVRRMGLSLKQAGVIAQKMLNLDGFLTDMYELMSMTNGSVDFSSAFDKGIVGDIKGMTEDIMNNIGTTQKFNEMDYLTRMKIANTLNMSVDELAKSVKMREQLIGLSEKEKTYIESNLDRMGDINMMSKDDIKNRLEQLQSTDRLYIAWDKIKGVFIKSIMPLMEGFADLIDAASPLIDILIGAFKILGMTLKPLGLILKGMMLPIKMIANLLEVPIQLITKFVDSIFAADDGFNKVDKKLLSLSNLVQLIGSGIALWFVGKKANGFVDSISEKIKSISFGNVFKTANADVNKAGEKIKNISNDVSDTITKNKNKTNESLDSLDKSVSKKSKSMNSNLMSVTSGVNFDILREVGNKALSTMITKGILEMSGIGKAAEDSVESSESAMTSTFSGISAIAGTMLATHLTDALQKVFSKKLEKIFEEGFKPAKKSFKNIFSDTPKMFETVPRKFGDVLQSPFKTIKKSFGNLYKSILSKPLTPQVEIPDLKKSLEIPKVDVPIEPKVNTEPIKTLNEKINERAKSKKIDLVKNEKSVTDISKKILEERETKTKRFTKTDTKIDTVDVKKYDDVFKKLSAAYDKFENLISNGWKKIKTVVSEIVGFVVDTAVRLSKGVGDIIRNVVGSISDSLNKFGRNAIRGAIALTVVSSAFWVFSSAMKNFDEISWDGLLKGTVALGGFIVMSKLLTSKTGDYIKSAIGIGLLSASLIPLAYSLKMFNDVEWESMIKGLIGIGVISVIADSIGKSVSKMVLGSVAIALLGASLIPLAYSLKMFNDVDFGSILKSIMSLSIIGTIASVVSATAPEMVLGSIAIALLGASLIPLAYSLKMFNDVEWESMLKGVAGLLIFGTVGSVLSVASPFLIATSTALGIFGLSLMATTTSLKLFVDLIDTMKFDNLIVAKDTLTSISSIDYSAFYNISAGLIALSAGLASLSITDKISGFFKNSSFEQFKDVPVITNSLVSMNDVILQINDTIQNLMKTIADLDFSKLIDNFDIDSKITKHIDVIKDQTENVKVVRDDVDKKMSYNNAPKNPSKSSTAQDVSVGKIYNDRLKYEKQRQDEIKYTFDDVADTVNANDNKKIERLLQMIYDAVNKPEPELVVQMDGYKMGKIVKKYNNY